jgi:hypothetical protein
MGSRDLLRELIAGEAGWRARLAFARPDVAAALG